MRKKIYTVQNYTVRDYCLLVDDLKEFEIVQFFTEISEKTTLFKTTVDQRKTYTSSNSTLSKTTLFEGLEGLLYSKETVLCEILLYTYV